MVRELTEDFLDDANILVDAMEQAARRSDRKSFRADCHGLRSSSANVGARAITRLCQASATGADLAREGPDFCARLRQEVALYREEVDRYLNRIAPSTKRLF
jgi:two-component system sensor histidine kinase RpfC